MDSLASSHKPITSVAGVLVITTIYAYFLIFAQFAFLRLVQSDGMGAGEIRWVMGAMALSGVATSLGVARTIRRRIPLRVLMADGFVLCGFAALLALVSTGLLARMGTSLLIGCGLGITTVSLAAATPLWFSHLHRGKFIGLGTGLGYALCNIPSIFAGTPKLQAGLALGLSVVGGVAAGVAQLNSADIRPANSALPGRGFTYLVAAFLALVWLDSAAFYILQSTPLLNRFGWATSSLQWSNAVIHLIAACVGGWWLDRGNLRSLLLGAFGLLATASVLVGSTHQSAAELTHWLYAAGVSLYSTALVFAPASGAAADLECAAQRAGRLYAVAGWIGSALGIGMAQDMHGIPRWFPWAAGTVVLSSILLHSKKVETPTE